MNQKLLCPSHNELIQIVCFNKSCQSFRFGCYECLKKEHHLSHTRDLKSIQEFYEYQQLKQKEYLDFAQTFQNYFDNTMNLFNQIRNKLSFVQNTKIDTLDQMNDVLSLFLQNQKNQDQFSSIMMDIQKKLISVLQNFNENLIEPQIDLSQQNPIKQDTKYQLIQNIRESLIYSFSFNHNSSMFAAGYSTGQIAVFELEIEQIRKQQQILNGHKGSVYSLEFFNYKNCFLSGGQDRMILIWAFESKIWICQQKIDAHSDWISHIIINKNNNLIISSSGDKTIQFWNKDEQWKCCQTITAHLNTVCSLSLNETEDQLISCSCDSTIKIFEFKNSNWIILQNINVEKLGFRLCFINNFTFVFQSENSLNLSVYKFNQQDGLYHFTKNVQVQNGENCSNLFPQKFIKSKNIILNKNGSKVNLIKILPDEEFQLIDAIDFSTRKIFGNMSNDGQYLCTWDWISKQIQIRRCIQ
ncbi:unnamed protein product [Paramecium primaurelia]|uniref:WD40-repeat-containing domain n=1 Tax=Paramecium primaurelia TaxID=5886 RepID=A0A8S1PEE1_PARPR|nr:unnamed protein product [Paramecium primaurelia]